MKNRNNSLLIVVPTLNTFHFLANLIESLECLDFINWRLIFIDGNSSKAHRSWLMQTCEDNEKCQWVQESSQNKGIFGAMNLGFKLAKKNEWIVFWGSDDRASNSNSFKKIFNYLNNIEDLSNVPDLIITKSFYFDEIKKIKSRETIFLNQDMELSGKQFRRILFNGSTPPHQATIFGPGSRRYLNEYSPEFLLAADLDYFLSISKNYSLKVLVRDMQIVEICRGGISAQQTKRRLKEVIRSYRKSFKYFWIWPIFRRYIIRVSDLIRSFFDRI